MEYNFREIEKKWQKRWVENKTYQVTEDETKKKFYVLNMFPYPSGAGLHVGHPLGYIASDIYARYKRLQGFNVLNPMGVCTDQRCSYLQQGAQELYIHQEFMMISGSTKTRWWRCACGRMTSGLS